MPRRDQHSLLRGRLLVLVAIALSAFTLRVAVTAFTPLAERIGDDIGFSSTVVGVFGMVPTAMFAVFGLVTPAIAARLGLEATAALAMLMAGVGMVVRAVVSDVWVMLGFSAVALAGMGIGNVVIPPLVKRYFSDRLALLSSLYITLLQLGTVLPALVAVPVADQFGWRTSIGMWAVVGFAAALPWLMILANPRVDTASHRRHGAQSAPAGRPWHSPVGWGMALMFGATSLTTYAMFTWIPKILTDAGASDTFGGSMLALFALVGLIAALGVPPLCVRMANPFPIVVACVVAYAIGFAGLFFAPMAAPVVWIFAIGLGPSSFPLALTLINLRTRTPAGSQALSGFAQGIGYTIACVGPLLFGVLHDATHGWGAPFAMLGVAAAVQLGAAWVACKPRMLEDSWSKADRRR
ncbi:MAG: MFS transporter [Aldersonia sp.]|nr:MFS transporter [Aldersonia sp.]